MATSHPKILRASSTPIDPVWLEEEVAELARLVEVGETVDVVGRLGEMMRAPRRLEPAGAGAGAPATATPTAS